MLLHIFSLNIIIIVAAVTNINNNNKQMTGFAESSYPSPSTKQIVFFSLSIELLFMARECSVLINA